MKDNLLLTARIMGLGWYVSISILIGAFAGIWLDQRLDTAPFLMIFGTLLGAIIASYGTYKMLKSIFSYL
jgi:ATP synthase protein I